NGAQLRLQDILEKFQRIVVNGRIVRLQPKINRVQIQIRIQESEEAEDSLHLLLNGFVKRTHDGLIGVSGNVESFQDLIGTILAHDFRGENGFHQMHVQHYFGMHLVNLVESADHLKTK